MVQGRQLISIISIIGLFTLLDYIAHYLDFLPGLDALPAGYFLNKIIFGVIILFVLINFVRVRSELILAGITALALQFRYFQTQGYDNVKMIITHAVLLYAAFWIHRYMARRHENIYPLVIG